MLVISARVGIISHPSKRVKYALKRIVLRRMQISNCIKYLNILFNFLLSNLTKMQNFSCVSKLSYNHVIKVGFPHTFRGIKDSDWQRYNIILIGCPFMRPFKICDEFKVCHTK